MSEQDDKLIELNNRLIAAREASDAAWERYYTTAVGKKAVKRPEWLEYVETTLPERQVTDELITVISGIALQRSEG